MNTSRNIKMAKQVTYSKYIICRALRNEQTNNNNNNNNDNNNNNKQ